MNKAELVRTFLLGVLVALVAVAVFRPGQNTAQAQAAVGGGNYQFFATNNGKDCPAFFIVDTSTRRFAYYTQQNFSNSHKFGLYVTRFFGDDLQLDDLTAKNNNGLTYDEAKKEVAKKLKR